MKIVATFLCLLLIPAAAYNAAPLEGVRVSHHASQVRRAGCVEACDHRQPAPDVAGLSAHEGWCG